MSAESSDNQRLRDRLKQGDRQVLADVFSQHRDRLARMVALRLDPRLGGRVSASDVLQEAYVDALKRVDHFLEKPDMSVFVWLRLVAGQRLIDVHRQHLGAQMRNAGQEVSIHGHGTIGASSACLARELVGRISSPSHEAQRHELFDQLQSAMNQLDPIDREVLSLRHFEELSNNETAEILGIEKAAASKRYVRALERLKDLLAKLADFQE
jgi:RNA polymerase sigma-70 factor (ECF subfamily)